MDGFLNILKPPGMTSHDVVKFYRKYFNGKVGHAGTLDPGATGVLPVCIGKATKAVEFLVDENKTYRAEINLGVVTDTGDKAGKIIEEKNVPDLSREKIETTFTQFIGDIWQVPPMYSAVKYKGERLYRLAKRGIEVPRRARKVRIYDIEVISCYSRQHEGRRSWYILFDVECSKGTYIRSLAVQLGESLGTGAHLSFLIRSKVGPFTLENTCTLQETVNYFNNNEINRLLIPVDKVLSKFPAVIVGDNAALKIANGSFLLSREVEEGGKPIPENKVRVYRRNGTFLAMAIWKRQQDNLFLKPEKVFVS